ncbi:MAG: cytochrome C [Bacteroidetes bacterium]|nr:MAG: cytochrome C [Bacteroidota bacterium]MBL1143437.1 cytochrome C [Bacteroidota bacterium]NOG56241.1 c-type cytochrome [Bacteroidota bacterium]
MKLLLFTKSKVHFQALFVFLFLFAFSTTKLVAQEDGEKLFKSYCASCHSTGSNQLVGPGLAGVSDKYEREWLYNWIKDSQGLIASGDADAVAIFEEFNKIPMPAQPVNNEQIDAILDFIKASEAAAPAAEVVVAETTSESTSGDGSSDGGLFVVLGLIILFLIVISILRGVSHSIQTVRAEQIGAQNPEERTMLQAFFDWINANKTIVALISIVILSFVAKLGWDAAVDIGIYTGYQPEQPIKFSHKLHAGTNGIDCNYCHSSASFSKSAGIPSPNLCMNCHTYIQEGPQYGKEEIAKIYAALDFDPVTKKYGTNQKPIKWVKVHNLPDHVYFNHSQHVTVGKIACQKCHGPVEEFTVGKQHESLTMGWCIDCHRETKVQMTDNGYYDEIHKRLPEKLKAQYLEDGTITVSELGGIECAKCHY